MKRYNISQNENLPETIHHQKGDLKRFGSNGGTRNGCQKNYLFQWFKKIAEAGNSGE